VAGVNRERIRHVAALAELSLTDEEEERLGGDIERILTYVAELEGVDTSSVPPTAHVREGAAADGLRVDEPAPGLSHEEALAAAPCTEEGGFSVPGFVE
jgi:aspartyl-tRNA(Asn)/glutamyl-tRNA(Gln) amidotransferase subunit C